MLRLTLYVAALLVLSQAISKDDLAKMKEKLVPVAQNCIQQTGAGQDDLQTVMAKMPPTTKEGKCFMFCMHNVIGFQDASGKMNAAAILGWVDSLVPLDADYADKMRIVANKCIDTVDDSGDKCDAATAVFSCYTEECKKHFFNKCCILGEYFNNRTYYIVEGSCSPF